MLAIGQVPIHLGDASCFEHYGRYDVLFMYGPCIGEVHRRLMERISRDAKSGALLVLPHGQFYELPRKSGFLAIDSPLDCDVFKKDG